MDFQKNINFHFIYKLNQISGEWMQKDDRPTKTKIQNTIKQKPNQNKSVTCWLTAAHFISCYRIRHVFSFRINNHTIWLL